jgi:hypothetical protein
MSKGKGESRGSTGSKAPKGVVLRTVFPRDATPDQVADQINAMIRELKGQKAGSSPDQKEPERTE